MTTLVLSTQRTFKAGLGLLLILTRHGSSLLSLHPWLKRAEPPCWPMMNMLHGKEKLLLSWDTDFWGCWLTQHTLPSSDSSIFSSEQNKFGLCPSGASYSRSISIKYRSDHVPFPALKLAYLPSTWRIKFKLLAWHSRPFTTWLQTALLFPLSHPSYSAAKLDYWLFTALIHVLSNPCLNLHPGIPSVQVYRSWSTTLCLLNMSCHPLLTLIEHS